MNDKNEKPSIDPGEESIAGLDSGPQDQSQGATDLVNPGPEKPRDFRLISRVDEDFSRVVGPDVHKVLPTSEEYPLAKHVMRDRKKLLGKNWLDLVQRDSK